MSLNKKLTARSKVFCDLLLENPKMKGAEAYRQAGYKCVTNNVAATGASNLLRHPAIQKYLAENRELALEAAVEKMEAENPHLDGVNINAVAIAEELIRIHQADADELCSYWRTACRYCWSFGYGYKRTPEEYKRAQAAHRDLVAANEVMPPYQRKVIPPFDPMGGDDFDCLADPDPSCTECRGLGVGTAVIKDTRKLSKGARALYAGIQQTKDGIKVLTHSKEGFTALLMRHAGMLVDRQELSGPKGGPIPLAGMSLPADPIEAARVYAEIMGGVK